jgi:hypothetical protein
MDAAAEFLEMTRKMREILAEEAEMSVEEYEDKLYIGFDEFYE